MCCAAPISASAAGAEEAYTRLRSIMREVQFEPPLALRQLAQITDFDLFVTTTFDPLLEQAINLERYGGQTTADVIAYAPNRVADLPVERSQLQRTVIYHLLGRLSASPTYVVSDEDMLEFICALQSEHLTPEKLFHELEHNHLLLIGSDSLELAGAPVHCAWPSASALSDPRDVSEVFADDHTMQDGRLVSFLQRSQRAHARVYGSAEAFVAELHARWSPAPAPSRRQCRRQRAAADSCRHRARCRRTRFSSATPREDLPAVQTTQGRARRRRTDDLVRSRPARRRRRPTTARSARTSAAAATSCRSSRQRRNAAMKRTSAASGATRSTERATSPKAA